MTNPDPSKRILATATAETIAALHHAIMDYRLLHTMLVGEKLETDETTLTLPQDTWNRLPKLARYCLTDFIAGFLAGHPQ